MDLTNRCSQPLAVPMSRFYTGPCDRGLPTLADSCLGGFSFPTSHFRRTGSTRKFLGGFGHPLAFWACDLGCWTSVCHRRLKRLPLFNLF